MERRFICARKSEMKKEKDFELTIDHVAIMRRMRSIGRSIPIIATLADCSHKPVAFAGRLPNTRRDAIPKTILNRMSSHTDSIVLMCSGRM